MRNIFCTKQIVPAVSFDAITRRLCDNFGLTPREIQVANALLRGGSDKRIADDLHISMPTLRSHVQHLFDKLGVNSRTELCSKVFLAS